MGQDEARTELLYPFSAGVDRRRLSAACESSPLSSFLVRFFEYLSDIPGCSGVLLVQEADGVPEIR